MKIDYKNKILLYFFIFIFSFFIIYYGLGKMCYNNVIIEGLIDNSKTNEIKSDKNSNNIGIEVLE